MGFRAAFEMGTVHICATNSVLHFSSLITGCFVKSPYFVLNWSASFLGGEKKTRVGEDLQAVLRLFLNLEETKDSLNIAFCMY